MSGACDRKIIFWNLKKQTAISKIDAHDGDVYSIGIIKGSILYSGSWDKTVKLW